MLFVKYIKLQKNLFLFVLMNLKLINILTFTLKTSMFVQAGFISQSSDKKKKSVLKHKTNRTQVTSCSAEV